MFESVYETCLCDEITNAGIPFEQQVEIPVCYKGRQMEVGFRADLVVGKELVIEIKSVEKLRPTARSPGADLPSAWRVSQGLVDELQRKAPERWNPTLRHVTGGSMSSVPPLCPRC